MKKRLSATITHLREDIGKVEEPQLKAMFETPAEVLGGPIKAFHDYEKKNEAAWRWRATAGSSGELEGRGSRRGQGRTSGCL
jgi:hypothetical protein